MNDVRMCSRPTCTREAVATLTFVYSDRTAVLGQLAVNAEPHTYDLCVEHSKALNVPQGWEVMKLAVPALDEVDAHESVTEEVMPVPHTKVIHQDKELLKDDVPSAPSTQHGHLRLITGQED